MKKKLLFLLFFVLNISYCQDNCDQVFEGCDKPCGPKEKRDERIILNDIQNNTAPYSYVIHQTFNRVAGNFSSTSSFISPNVLITAHHNVVRKGLIQGIRFYNPINHEESLYFKKREYKIYTYKNRLNSLTDIAIIVFKDPKKIAPYYKGHFVLNDIININPETEAHLTGFPCDVSDTKIDKKDLVKNLHTDDKYNLIGYNMFTCTGDSGAPLWVLKDKTPTIIGIHHGGNEGYIKNCFNISARINNDILNWINKYIN
jgi:V8-like Glu-specific endopeptidase